MMKPEPNISNVRRLLISYQPGVNAATAISANPPILLVGISGAGKDTIKRALLKTGKYEDFISYTTRQPRMNHGVLEQHNVDYRFIDMAEAERMIRSGEFIEAKEYSGNIYGTGIEDLLRASESGKRAVNDIEVHGVEEYMRLSSRTSAIFLLPPSYDEWQRRLFKRYENVTESRDNIDQRIKTAEKELIYALSKPYYTFVINDDVQNALDEIDAFIGARAGTKSLQNNAKQLAKEILREVQTKHLAL